MSLDIKISYRVEDNPKELRQIDDFLAGLRAELLEAKSARIETATLPSFNLDRGSKLSIHCSIERMAGVMTIPHLK